jgi:hypothetical protein
MVEHMNGKPPEGTDDVEPDEEFAPFEAAESGDDIEMPGEFVEGLAAADEDVDGPEGAESQEVGAPRTARQRVMDHFLDTEGPQSLQQILEGTALDPKLLGVTLVRAVKAGLLERVETGVYALPPKPEPPAPPEPPRLHFGFTHVQWLHAMHAWRIDPSSWPENMGPRPGRMDCRAPFEVVSVFNKQFDEIQEATAATEAEIANAANLRLWEQAMRACGANVLESADIGPLVQAEAAGITRDVILRALLQFDPDGVKRGAPAPLKSFRDMRVLFEISKAHAMALAVKAAEAAAANWANAPAVFVKRPPPGRRGAGNSLDPAPMPRSPRNSPAGAAEAVRVSPETAAMLDRYQIGPADGRPWTAAPAPQSEFDESAWIDLMAGYMDGVLGWNEERMGPPPGYAGCKVPHRILKSYGF